MVPRSGAGDFVAGQSHQNRFRNLRFLKTSLLPAQWRAISLGAWIPTISASAPRTRSPSGQRKRQPPTHRAYTHIPRWCVGGKRPRKHHQDPMAVGAVVETQAPSMTKSGARNARIRRQRQIRQRAPRLTRKAATEQREILKNRRFLSRLFGSFFLGGKKELRVGTRNIPFVGTASMQKLKQKGLRARRREMYPLAGVSVKKKPK